jgi:hypothetical protein
MHASHISNENALAWPALVRVQQTTSSEKCRSHGNRKKVLAAWIWILMSAKLLEPLNPRYLREMPGQGVTIDSLSLRGDCIGQKTRIHTDLCRRERSTLSFPCHQYVSDES